MSERNRRGGNPRQRLHQTEAGVMIVCNHMSGDGVAFVREQPYRLGFGNEIAYGEYKPVGVDENAITSAFGT